MNTKQNKYAGVFLMIGFNLILLMGLGWLWTTSVHALTEFTVNTTADTHDAVPGNGVCADNNGTCSLRAAIEETNALAGADGVNLPAGTYFLSEGELSITDALMLNGNSAIDTIIDAQSNSRVFKVDHPGGVNQIQVSFSKLTIQRGKNLSQGGGVWNDELLSISNSVIQNNEGSWGGGVFNEGAGLTMAQVTIIGNTSEDGGGIGADGGVVVLNNSSIRDNIADYSGGGIGTAHGVLFVINSVIENNQLTAGGYAKGGGIDNLNGEIHILNSIIRDNTVSQWSVGGGIHSQTTYGDSTKVTIENSTLNANFAGYGGGVYIETSSNASANTSIHNSTVSGNQAWGDAGGIFVTGIMTITHSTIAENILENSDIASAGGISVYPSESQLTIKNTIVANNDSLLGENDDCWGSFFSSGYNLIEKTQLGCGFQAAQGDIFGFDPLLGSLAENGGNTLTHALLTGSPAIDTGSCTDIYGNRVPIDQRGFFRPFEGNCDIGAYELDFAEPLFYFLPIIKH